MTRIGAVLCALFCAWAPAAKASRTEQSILMDDNQLIYASPAHIEQAMQQIKALGIDRVKVSVVWSLVSPAPNAARKPNFDASNPNAYPPGAWTRYDRIVELARQLGLGVYFQLTAPAPRWALTPGHLSFGAHSWSHEPKPALFQQFAEAVGRRYSGSFIPSRGPTPVLSLPLAGTTLTVNEPLLEPGQPIPAVTWWGIWNEPNEVGWLSPQWHVVDGRNTPYSPLLDRQMTDAGYAGLVAAGHAGETILIGETASGGNIRPGQFLRQLYCVDGHYHPFRGETAAALGCPTSGSRAAFVNANPALFHAAGFAHHPYSFDVAPNRLEGHGFVTLANLGSYERSLDRIFATYGQPTGLPFYLTEWGYKTNPPNPYVKTSLYQQEVWLNEGEYMTWRNPRVRVLAQFLLFDDKPRASAARGTLSYWSTFQSGLYYSDGNPKPSLDSFRIPIWVPSPRTGDRVTVWGQLRPANHAQVQSAVLDFRPSARAAWSALTNLQTASPEGFLLAHVPIAERGMIRLAWFDPNTGQVDYSRTVTIH